MRKREWPPSVESYIQAIDVLYRRCGAAACSKQAADEGSDPRKIVRLAGGVVFLGEVDAKKRPHGDGELLLRDGSVHAGVFASGAAHGRGVYYDRKGAVHAGLWVTNFRTGAFTVLDPSGGQWADSYDDTGKRSARKRLAAEGAAPPKTPAVACRRCAVRFHPDRNYRCRRHKGLWQEATQKWLCCDARDVDAPGCHFSTHEPVPAAEKS